MEVLLEKTGEAEPVSHPGLLFVVSGPSGVGKDTLLDLLFDRMNGLTRSVSATTRAPRPGEVDGRDYHFLSREQFESDIAAHRFLEYMPYNSQLYGTPRAGLTAQRDAGNDVVLKIEVKGAAVVREVAPDAILIFIRPPSLEELELRLRARETDTEAHIRERMRIAQEEMAQMRHFDYEVVNDDRDKAVDLMRCIVVAERCRIRRR